MASEFNVVQTFPGKTINDPVSIYGIAEMNRRAEVLCLKIRSELARIGCDLGTIKVNRQGIYLLMQFRYQVILTDPYEVLSVLKKIPRNWTEDEVWEQVNLKVKQFQRKNRKTTLWAIGSLACMMIIVALMLILTRA